MVDISCLCIGDFVWIKRYKNKKERKRIPKGHDEGPALIIKKTNTRVYALMCTSNNKCLLSSKAYYINRIDDNYTKNTYVLLDKVVLINSKNYIKKINIIDYKLLKDILKKIYLLHQQNKIAHITNKDVKINYDPADVIEYRNKLYIINKSLSNKYECYPLINASKYNKYNLNKKKYSIDFDNIKYIRINKSAKLSFFNKYEYLLDLINRIMVDKNYYDSSYGKIIHKGKCFLLIYKYDNNYYHSIRIYLNNKHKIKFKEFSSDLEEVILKRSREYKIYRRLNRLDFNTFNDVIKKLKKNKKKR